ncbi:lipoate--protein ligase family protein [Thermostilla marina]
MSSSPLPCRLLWCEPRDGVHNMAVDELLLREAEQDGTATVRLYRWSPATLSLGYFQRLEDRRRHAASASCPIVRRPSGGGAILHDDEWTYSIALPLRHPLAAKRDVLYRVVHDSLATVLNAAGAPVYAHGDTGCHSSADVTDLGCAAESQTVSPANVPADRKAFLCFQRHCPGDLLIAGHKVVGSAQRRLRGAVLQHGSILFRRSPFAPELPGLDDLCLHTINRKRVLTEWLRLLRGSLFVTWVKTDESSLDISAITKISEKIYGSSVWTEKRRSE